MNEDLEAELYEQMVPRKGQDMTKVYQPIGSKAEQLVARLYNAAQAVVDDADDIDKVEGKWAVDEKYLASLEIVLADAQLYLGEVNAFVARDWARKRGY